MSTATLVSVEEYLATSWRPDRDLVAGVLVERNVGQKDHGKLQRQMLLWFCNRERLLQLTAFPEQRIRVALDRFRIPDVCVVELPEPDEQVFTTAPFICVEVLSPDDTFPRLQERFDDYLSMGVPNIWAIDPTARRAWTITRLGFLEALDGILRTTDGRVELPLTDLFTQ